MNDQRISRIRGTLLGLACGDAVGMTVEFKPRGTFPPVTDMTGGGPFKLKAGQWTDDTSMALCLADSLLAEKWFSPADQMERYVSWMRDGYNSCTGKCFDIGNTVRKALNAFLTTGEPFSGPTGPEFSGNGSIMRLAPIPIFFSNDVENAMHYAGENSRTTHGSGQCIDATRFFAYLLVKALNGASKEELCGKADYQAQTPQVKELAEGIYMDKGESEIHGTGYVIQSLEAALWCFARTDSFEQAILAAANLGDDADTTAAVCGQIAGAFYGEEGIPEKWRDTLADYDKIAKTAEALHKGGNCPIKHC